MFTPSTRLSGGDLPDQYRNNVDFLLNEFGKSVVSVFEARQISRPALVRSMLRFHSYILMCNTSLFVVGQIQFGMSTTLYVHLPDIQMDSYRAFEWVRGEFGVEDAFTVAFPLDILDQSTEERAAVLRAIAESHVEAELQRSMKVMNLVPINPIFGPASYTLDEKLVFVLMPFRDDLTKIYRDIVKPTVGSLDLVCRRADDYKTNKVVVQDIWKAICEARIVIADLTDLNPNVMYELGVAHTVGKETVLIYQIGSNMSDSPSEKFPFDLAHIRRIEYEDNAIGGRKLEQDLVETVRSILKPTVLSS